MNEIDQYLKKTTENYKLNKINNIFLTNYEIKVLKKYNITYETCNDYNTLLYLIDNELYFLNEQDLEQISLSISERNYYQNTNK